MTGEIAFMLFKLPSRVHCYLQVLWYFAGAIIPHFLLISSIHLRSFWADPLLKLNVSHNENPILPVLEAKSFDIKSWDAGDWDFIRSHWPNPSQHETYDVLEIRIFWDLRNAAYSSEEIPYDPPM